ncbi:carboxymuconolactone decarboxylase family protein [Paraburkholderia caffeinilytica]|uniref:carboxymuconolactone decarboxylase family protein n=1 Tax=Paraburkholderia caffeinilytica TaxID=1761016 RepID=UPI003DA05D59
MFKRVLAAALMAVLWGTVGVDFVTATDQLVSRIPLVSDDTSDLMVQKSFSDVRAKGSQPLNLHRTMANAPKMMLAAGVMAHAIRFDVTVPRVYSELAIIRSAQLNGGHYEEMQHRPMAMSCGLRRDQVDAIADWRKSNLFNARQRAVLDWSEGLFRQNGPSDTQFAALKKQFSDQEIVELTMTATTYAGTAMFTRAMHTPLEPNAGNPNDAYGNC